MKNIDIRCDKVSEENILGVLEYLMVYTASGLPIYSKCYGTFCKTAFKEPELLTGFLSALETIPPTIGGGLSLQSVKMGSTEMRFSKTTPHGHSVVIGLSENLPEVAERVFQAVSKTLESDLFKDIDWNIVSSKLMETFENELLTSTLVNALHGYGGFSDDCTLGDMCPIHTTAVQSRRQRVWVAVKAKYAAMRERMFRKSTN
ncbi:MAG: hypothetical protein ACW99V_06855, partial [Candidatus Thorarchaeota archaeon]|jgi:hypothetical protein